MKFFDVDGARIKVDEYGNGNLARKTLFLVHGGPGVAGYMRSLGDQLAQDYRIIDYYQRGVFGTEVSRSYTIADHVEDLRRVITAYSVPGCPNVLVGHSWGAILGFCFSAQHGPLLEKMIALTPSPLDPETSQEFSQNIVDRLTPEQRAQRERVSEEIDGTLDEDKKLKLATQNLALITPVYNYDPGSVSSMLLEYFDQKAFVGIHDEYQEMLKDGSILRTLDSIRIPVILFLGKYDPIPYKKISAQMRNHVQSMKNMFLYENAGHFPWVEPEASEQFIKDLKGSFLP